MLSMGYPAYPVVAVPRHVVPPSLVVMMTRSTPEAVSVGAVPPGHLMALGHVTVADPPLVSVSRTVRQAPDAAPIKVSVVAAAMVADTELPSVRSTVTVPEIEPSG